MVVGNEKRRDSLRDKQLRDFRNIFLREAYVLAGFTLLFLWTWIYLQDSFAYSHIVFSGTLGSLRPWNVAILFFVVVFATVGVISRSIDFNFRNKKILISIFIIMTIGVVTLCSANYLTGDAAALAALIGAMAIGGATPIFYIEFVRIYTRFNLRNIILIGAMATILCSLSYYLLSIFPHMIGSAIPILFPFGMLWCLLTSLKSKGLGIKLYRIINDKVYIPWKLNLTALFQGMGFGAGRWFFDDTNTTGWLSGSEYIVYLCAYIASALVLINIVALMKSNFDKLIYKIGFSLLSVGTLLLLLDPFQQIGGFVAAFGYRFIDLLIWTMTVYLAVSKRVSLNWLSAWPTACLYLGIFVGYSLVRMAIDSNGAIPIQAIMVGVSFAILLAALIMTSSKNEMSAWGSIRPSDDYVTRPYLHESIQRLASQKDFTSRQGDVLGLLAEGFSKRDIAKELCLSQETIKVHIRNIYRKLDVHSQKEVMALIEQEEMLLAGDE